MPLSLRIIKVISKKNIVWEKLHFADVLSLFYSIMIDDCESYLMKEKQRILNERGITEIRSASEEDFNNL